MNYPRVKPLRSSSRRAERREDSPLVGAIRKRFYRESDSTSNGVPIHVTGPHGQQCAGYVVVSEDGRRLLRKTRVRESVHFCRRYGGFGVELDALQQACKLRAEVVQLVFEDSDRVLEAPLAAFAKEGHRDTLGGFGEQVFLPLAAFRDLSDPQGVLFDLGGQP